MLYRVTKEFKFDAAHRLNNYVGKCKNIHGHTYKVALVLQGIHLDKRGILCDFGTLKKKFGSYLDDKLDHATLVNNKDQPLIDFLNQEGAKHFIISGNTTAENIAAKLYGCATNIFEGSSWSIISLSVWETATSRVEVF